MDPSDRRFDLVVATIVIAFLWAGALATLL